MASTVDMGAPADGVGQDAADPEVAALVYVLKAAEEGKKKGGLEGMLAAERALSCVKELRDRNAVDSGEVQRSAERLCVRYNTLGVKSFKSDRYDQAIALFNRSIRLTDQEAGISYFGSTAEGTQLRERLRATTLNNLGCMERRRGGFERALHYLVECSQLEENKSAATNLNISALLTQMGRHAEAIGAARRSIGLLTVQLDEDESDEKRQETVSLLVIAYHNLAMAQEGSGSPQDGHDATQSYQTALDLATQEL
eukprot:gene10383-15988_t